MLPQEVEMYQAEKVRNLYPLSAVKALKNDKKLITRYMIIHPLYSAMFVGPGLSTFFKLEFRGLIGLIIISLCYIFLECLFLPRPAADSRPKPTRKMVAGSGTTSGGFSRRILSKYTSPAMPV